MVGKWVAGYVVLPPTPPTTNISLLSDVRQRTNLAWRSNTMVQINAYNTTHQHLFHCSAMRVSAKTMDYSGVGVCAGGGGGCNTIPVVLFFLMISFHAILRWRSCIRSASQHC